MSDRLRYDGDVPLKVADAYYSLEAEQKMQFGFTFKLHKVRFPIKLMKHDKGLQTLKEISLSNGEKVYGPFLPVLKNFNDKPYLFYYLFSEEDERIKLMAAEIVPSDLSLKTPEELLSIEQKNVGLQQASDLLYNYKFELTPSPDKSRWLALWSSGINNRFFFAVLDGSLKRLRTADETISGQRELVVKSACVDNAGNVFISYVADKQAHIFSSSANGKKMDQEVKLGAANAFEVFVLPSLNSTDIQVAGTYKEGKDMITGVFSQTLNSASFTMSNPVMTAFPATLVEQFDNDGWANTKAKKYGLYEIKLQPLLLADGTVDLVGEFRRTELGVRTSFIVAGGILNVHFKNKGVAFSRIPKARVSAGSTIGDSYNAVVAAGGLVIFTTTMRTTYGRTLPPPPTVPTTTRMLCWWPLQQPMTAP